MRVVVGAGEQDMTEKGKVEIVIVLGGVQVGVEQKSRRSRRETKSGLMVALEYIRTSYITCNVTYDRRAFRRKESRVWL